MSITALTTFVRIQNKSGKTQLKIQNGAEGQVKLDGTNYDYLGFVYSGSAVNLTGDNLEASLVFSSNWLTLGYAEKAVMNSWRVRVTTCVMKESNWTVANTLTQEFWVVASMGYDDTQVELLLGSGIDAVGANAPTRTLSTALVGQLPVTGAISKQ